jgi:pimeloyl-ACP methyl ester carboxylesterase
MRRIKGTRDLVFDGIEAITNLVQKTHTEVAERWTRRAGMVQSVQAIADPVHALHMAGANANYAAVRGVSRGVGALLRTVVDPLLPDDHASSTPLSVDAIGTLPWVLDHLECTVNGFFGDHLAKRNNGLDLGMHLRHEGAAIAPEDLSAKLSDATSKVCVFVHGLSATEWSWVLYADRVWENARTCYAEKLHEDLGYTPLFVRYNTGRHVCESGQALAELIDQVCEHYPRAIEEIVLVGHSMGGLVVRSAAHSASVSEAAWLNGLRHVFCIGSPHLGAPLEKGAHLLSGLLRNIPAAGATVPAAVIDSRSSGIKDLRHGYITEDEWRGEDADVLLHDNRQDLPLVDGVTYTAIAATITQDPEHPAGQLLGDILVRKPSASGVASVPERSVKFHSRKVFPGMNHLQLANHPAVYDVLRSALDESPA